MTLIGLEHTQSLLEDMRARGQLVCATVGARHAGGDAFTVTVGAGDPHPRWRLYCASKPMLAHTALTLLAEGGISVGSDVGELIGVSALAGLSIDGVLSHTGGLRSTAGEDFHPTDYRSLVELPRERVMDDTLTGTLFYSHTLAWSVLALVVEKLSGADFAEAVAGTTLDPFALTDTSYHLDPERTNSYSAVVDGAAVSLRDKRHPSYGSPNPSWGGASTIEDMLQFYTVLRERQVRGDPVVNRMAEERWFPGSEGRPPRSFGRGLFVDMQREGASSRCSERNFGHGASALFGRRDHLVNLFWYDVDAETAFGMILDGAVARGDARFPSIAKALYADLEGAR
ncbi:serine hydrolase domain-containing protein [uncultured Microbacterium sp.]|uniref:serine hydrolase domain-containing protein n=1 Tax=uncultured Microbacterium sp. TaxID=191216 RepID=UPI0028D0B256|nr:serine hydrolase domain-containing protein [uncultured Microbacterium sp.]